MDGTSIRKKLIGDEQERAVSPVIGVILMVAITVILAAVIAAFVLDIGQSQDTEVQAGVSVDGNTVTWTSGGSAQSVGAPGGDSGNPTCLTSVGQSADFSGVDSVVAYENADCDASGTTTVINTLD